MLLELAMFCRTVTPQPNIVQLKNQETTTTINTILKYAKK